MDNATDLGLSENMLDSLASKQDSLASRLHGTRLSAIQ